MTRIRLSPLDALTTTCSIYKASCAHVRLFQPTSSVRASSPRHSEVFYEVCRQGSLAGILHFSDCLRSHVVRYCPMCSFTSTRHLGVPLCRLPRGLIVPQFSISLFKEQCKKKGYSINDFSLRWRCRSAED